MDAFIWDKHYLTGETQVDEEHQQLVRLINRIVDAGDCVIDEHSINTVLDQLVNYAIVHFQHEEALMIAEGCAPEFINQHTQVHAKFAEQVGHMRNDAQLGCDLEHLLNFLTAWLAQHILGMDQCMARQIRAIRNGQSPAVAYEAEKRLNQDPITASMLGAMGSLYRIISTRNDALAKLNRSLETQVNERTRQLSEANTQLKGEHEQLHLAMQQLALTQKKLLESEHRRSLEAKRNLERFLSQIIDGDPVPTLVIDATHRVTHWNKACAKISRIPAEQMVGTQDQWKAFYPEPRPIMADLIVNGSLEENLNTYYQGIYRRSTTVDDAFEAENFFPHVGDQGRWLFFTAAPLRNADGVVIGAIETLQDVTERHQAQEALLQNQEQLEAQVSARTRELSEINQQLEAERQELTHLLSKVDEAQQQLLQSEKMAAIGQLAAGVAHEINNPVGFVNSNLGTLKTYTQQLLHLLDAYEQGDAVNIAKQRKMADLEFLREDLPALLDESQDGLERVTRIVQDLKDFSRVDQAEHQRADLNAALQSTLNVVRNELRYKAEIKLELGDIPEIDCVPAQLNQVFMNLLVNAAQAIPERGTITVRSGMERDHVWFEIEDTGSGMSEETRKRIFEPFFTTKPVGKGTGLGLSISYDIVVKKHNGRMDVRSHPGKGSCFRLWLPVNRQPKA
jgi:hemerythrin-like metal-binding protein